MPARRIAKNEVHVWSLALGRPPAVVDALRATLAPHELERAARLRVPQSAARFVVAHAGLREILGAYLGCDPALVPLSHGPSGKPAVASAAPGDVRFNLSHSEDLALCAVARARDVGIDVERVSAVTATEDAIAARYFSPAQAAAMRTAAGPARDRLFYRCWVRGEAYLKAEGVGLAAERPDLPPAVAAVPPEQPVAHPRVSPSKDGRLWTLLDLDPRPGYVAALLVEGRGLRVANCVWSLGHRGTPER